MKGFLMKMLKNIYILVQTLYYCIENVDIWCTYFNKSDDIIKNQGHYGQNYMIWICWDKCTYLKTGGIMDELKDDIIKMRYMILVKKGIVDKKYESCKNISQVVKEYDNQFIPGTVLLSEKAGYKLRIEYPMEWLSHLQK